MGVNSCGPFGDVVNLQNSPKYRKDLVLLILFVKRWLIYGIGQSVEVVDRVDCTVQSGHTQTIITFCITASYSSSDSPPPHIYIAVMFCCSHKASSPELQSSCCKGDHSTHILLHTVLNIFLNNTNKALWFPIQDTLLGISH